MSKYSNSVIVIFCERCTNTSVVQKTKHEYFTHIFGDAGFERISNKWLCPDCLEKRQQIIDSGKGLLDEFMNG